MTREEFKCYISSFGKKKGEFSKQELCDIGIRYKEDVIRQERNWDWLVKELGDYRTGEGFRKWLLSRRYALHLVEKNPKILDDKTVEEVSAGDVEESLAKQKEDLFKEKTQLRDVYNSYRRGMREEARIDSFKEHITDAVKSLAPLPSVQAGDCDLTKNATEMVMGFADLHLGIDFSNSYNEYNYEIAVKRVSKYVSHAIEYCRLNNVRRLNFLNLGDLISGTLHPTLRIEQGMNAADQVMKAAELVAEALNQLKAAAPEVIYRSVVDNHSRFMPNKDSHIEIESFNRIIDWFLEERLKDSGIAFAKDNLDIGVGMFKLINGKTMMFTHGHQDRKSTVFQDMVGLIREYPDYIFMGHYHNSAEHTFQGAKVFITGSIVGTDTYAYGRRLFGSPEQKLLLFNGDDVISIDVNLK